MLLPTLGGQTALNTAMALDKRGTLSRYGVEMIGAKREAIERGEDRQVFKDLMISDRAGCARQRDRPYSGRSRKVSRKDREPPADYSPRLHPRRHRRRHRL